MFIDGFPLYLKETVQKLTEELPFKTYNNISHYQTEERITYSLNGQSISFPYRIYIHEMEYEVFSKMSDKEKMIISCIYSRSHNGFIREKHIRNLLSMDYPEWVIPYIFKVCDEYVVEILEVVYESLKDRNTESIKEFCTNNQIAFCKSYNRIISYWNEFYRCDCYLYKNYIGRKLFTECFGAKHTMNRQKIIGIKS